jgi:hypothetical protein
VTQVGVETTSEGCRRHGGVIGAAARRNGTDFVAGRFNNRFHLRGASAEALRTLFERPPGATGAITILGAVLLLFSLVSLTRSLQRTFEDAWCLRPLGMRGMVHGVTGMGLLLASVLVLEGLVSVMRPLPAGTALAVFVRALVAVLGTGLVFLAATNAELGGADKPSKSPRADGGWRR